jgi:hypothetical protein
VLLPPFLPRFPKPTTKSTGPRLQRSRHRPHILRQRIRRTRLSSVQTPAGELLIGRPGPRPRYCSDRVSILVLLDAALRPVLSGSLNLAVACDAEQILFASINGKDGHRVRYLSGAIEDPEVNLTALKALEGTRPAFDNQDAKYFAREATA